MFVDQLSTINQFFIGIKPMGLGPPWVETYLEPQQQEQYPVMFINIET